MGGGWDDIGSLAWLVDGKAVGSDRWLSTMARTSGCRGRTWGREAPEINKEACGAVGWLGGGRSTVVDSSPLTKEEATGGGVLSGVVASGLSSKVLLHLQRNTEVRFLCSDGDRVGRGWCSMAS
jgi:hypothetical protein